MAVILSPKLMKGTVTASKLMYGLLSALTNVQNFQAGVIDLYQLIELVEGLLSVFGGLKKGAGGPRLRKFSTFFSSRDSDLTTSVVRP